MLDLKFIRENPDLVKESLTKRGLNSELVDEFLEYDNKRRDILYEVEQLRHKRNVASEKNWPVKTSWRRCSTNDH